MGIWTPSHPESFTNGAGAFNLTASGGNVLTMASGSVVNLSVNPETLSLPILSTLPGPVSINASNGNITMVFADPTLELRQWTIVDAQGQQTTVSLGQVQTGIAIPGSTFVLNDDSKFTKNKGE